MNSSYKIVLLGAFVVFVAVIGYYMLSGGDGEPDNPLEDEYAVQPVDGGDPADTVDPEPEPGQAPDPTRPVLDPVEERTIGTEPEPLPGIDPPTAEDPTTETTEPGTDPITDPERPGPDGSETNEGTGESEFTEPTDLDEGTRPGPGVEETPTQPETEEPVETEDPTRPIPPAPTITPRNYTVKSGDTLSSIAREIYGEESAWFQIAQANPTIDPKRLQVGQVIVLPNRESIGREREEVQPPAPGQDQTYTVRPGDNLSKIAKRFYGDSEAWDLIYARNRKAIGPRPDALKVGMELIIPQAYEGAE